MEANTMNHVESMPRWLHSLLGFVLGLVFLLLPFHAFLSTWLGTHIGWLVLFKSWKEILLAGVGLLVAGWLVARPERFVGFVRRPVVAATLLYVGVSLLVTLLTWRGEPVAERFAGLAFTYRYVLMLILAYSWMLYRGESRENLSRQLLLVLLELAVVVSAFGVMQALILPKDFLANFGYEKGVTIAPYILIDENPHAVRAFSSLRGPNDFAAFLVLPIVAVLGYAYYAKRSLRSWLGAALALMVWALFLSGSRSGWLAALVAVVVFFALLVGRKWWRHKKFRISVVSGFVVGAALIGLALVVPEVRLQVFHSSPKDSSLTEGSTSNHWQATAAGLKRVAQKPLGCGAGCAGPASYYGSTPRISENYYVQVAEEFGVVGLAAWIYMVYVLLRELFRSRHAVLPHVLFASFVGLSLVGLWLHVWADDPVSMIWFGLAGIALAAGTEEQITAKKLKKVL